MLSSPSPRNTAWMAHTRSTSLDLSPSISTVLGSPLTTGFPFPRVGNGTVSGSDSVSGSSSAVVSNPAIGFGSPRWSTISVTPYTPPPMYAPPGVIFGLGVPGTPSLGFLSPAGGGAAPRVPSRHHKRAKFFERSYLQRVECLLLVEIIASVGLILLYFHLCSSSDPSSPSASVIGGPAAEPSPREPSTPFLAFIPTPTSKPSVLLATCAYLCLVAAFRTGTQRIALSLDPISGIDNLDGARGLAVQMATLGERPRHRPAVRLDSFADHGTIDPTLRPGAAVGIMHLPLLVMLRHSKIMFGIAAWGLTALLVGGILYDSLRRDSNLEQSCNGDVATWPRDKELGGS
ncbi:BQ2448_7885 [Microbotryum intermedium]|uniref:BQ2448_7885 protein n=1 Tax=Microbotryum intermedium TaxID=269621 RepID=A0A238FUW9_9BASI|nr:BQ2448_7885 [Microbotryum intermedium]